MKDTVKQALESIDSLTSEQCDAMVATCFSEFDAIKDSDEPDNDEMRAYNAAARQFMDRKKTIIAGAAESEAGTETESTETSVTADSGEATEVTETASEASTETESTETSVTADSGEATETAPAETGEAVEATETVPVETGTEEASETPADPAATTASGEQAAEAETNTSAEGEAPAEPASNPAATGSDGDGTTTTSEETTVTASTADETIEVAEDNKPVVASAGNTPTTVTAGMDVQGISAGSEFKNPLDVGNAFVHRIRTVGRSSGNDGEKHTVATITASYPEDRVLDGNAQGNADKINKVLNDGAVVASGGFCAPLPVRYDIFGLGVTSRPVRDSLMMFNANRGGVRFVTPPVLSDLEDAVGLWTSTTDATPGTATKAELKVTCAQEVDAEIDAVTLQLEFGNFMTRAYPELVNRNNELGMIQHARFAEQELLSKMSNLSTDVTAASKLGIGIDFLNAIARGGSAYRNRNRMPRDTPLRVIAPDYVLDAMRTDLSQRIAGDNTIALADAAINNFLMAQNVRVTWHLDGTFGAQSGSSPLVSYPSTFDWYLFAEGSFLFLDGGTLDIGVVRDSDLVGTNDYKTFYETFEGVAMVGVEALVVTQDLLIEGATVGTIAPSGS